MLDSPSDTPGWSIWSDELRMRVPARPDQVRVMRRAVTRFVEELGWEPDEVDAIALAVGEACNNAVSYGQNGTAEAEVALSVHFTSGRCLEVEVRNAGIFRADMERLRGLPETYAVHGRGFALMNALMDEVEVTAADGETVVRLRKRHHS